MSAFSLPMPAAEALCGFPLQIYRVRSAKFGKLVVPGDALEIVVSGIPDSVSSSVIDCTILRKGETCAYCTVDVSSKRAVFSGTFSHE